MRSSTQMEQVIYENRILSRLLVEEELAELFNINSTDSGMLSLREHYRIDSGELGDGGKMAILASQALTQGFLDVLLFELQMDLILINKPLGKEYTVQTS